MKLFFLTIILLLGTITVEAQVSSSTAKKIVGTNTLPATCTAGPNPQVYVDTNATATSQFYICTSTNTWTLQTGGGGGLTVGTTTIASGANTRVLFEDSSVLGEDAGFSYNKTSDTILVTGSVIAGAATSAETANSFHAGGQNGVGGWSEFSNGMIDKSAGAGFTLSLRGNDDFVVATNGGTARLTLNSTAAAFTVPLTSSGATFSSATIPITFSNAAFQGCTSLGSSAGGVLTCTPSTAKVKQGFQFFSGGMDVVRRIQPQIFQYRPETRYADGGKTHLGLIAENLQSAYPLLVSATGAGMLQPEPLAIQAVLIDALKTLDARVSKLETENHQLKQQVRRLRRH